jgi:nucleotide-binding universal stress UspA family protein
VAGVRRTIARHHAGMDTPQIPYIPPPVGRPVRHVLLALDLGASSVRAADEAIDLAADQGAILLILSVVPPRDLPQLRHDDLDSQRQRRDRAAREIVARAAAKGVTATSVIWYGEPAAAILDAASSERADLVVLGSRKRTDLGRLLLGSVSSHVASEANCPVVVVPA